MPDNPNLTAAIAVADMVDPGSNLQQQIIDRASNLRRATAAVPQTKTDNDFLSGLEKANQERARLQGAAPGGALTPTAPQVGVAEVDAGGGGGTSPEASDNAEPSTPPPRKLTDPPVAPKQRSNFRKLEAERDALRARLAELEGKGNGSAPSSNQGPAHGTSTGVQGQQAQPSDSSTFTAAQVAAMTEELATLRSEVSLLDITRSPDFAARYEAPRALAIKQAKNISGAKGADVEAVLSMPLGSLREAKLDELLAELPPSTAQVVKWASGKLIELELNKNFEVENARSTASQRAAAREQQALAAAAQRSAEFDRLAGVWGQSVPALAPGSKEAPSITAEARKFFNRQGLSTSEEAAVALQAALVPSLLNENSSQAAEIERLRASLARYTNSMPGSDFASEEDGGAPAERLPNTPQARDAKFQRGLNQALSADPTFAAARRMRSY